MAGCASTNVNQQTPMTAPGPARPNQISLYYFVAASSDMPADSSLAGQVGAPSTPPTPEEIESCRKYRRNDRSAVGNRYTGHGHARDPGWSGIIAADRRRCNPWIHRFNRRWRCRRHGQAHGHRIRRRNRRDGYGRRGVCDDPSRSAKARFRNPYLVGKQIAWLNRTRRSGHSSCESGGFDRSWRRED